MPRKSNVVAKELNSTNLKSVLWQTLLDVRSKKIKVEEANAVSKAAKEIMGVVNAEIKIAQMGPNQFQSFVGNSTEQPKIGRKK